MYPGIWRQGDFLVKNPKTNGLMVLGRRWALHLGYIWVDPGADNTSPAVMVSSTRVVSASALRRSTLSSKT
jgi:hypothetical protein